MIEVTHQQERLLTMFDKLITNTDRSRLTIYVIEMRFQNAFITSWLTH